MTMCPSEFQEDMGTEVDATGPRRKAATGIAVTLGGAREILVVIADTRFSFKFRIASVTKPLASADGFHQVGCTTVISKFGGCYMVAPSGQVIVLHRRQRTYWLLCRVGVGHELEVLTIATVRASPEVEEVARGRQRRHRRCRTQAQAHRQI